METLTIYELYYLAIYFQRSKKGHLKMPFIYFKKKVNQSKKLPKCFKINFQQNLRFLSRMTLECQRILMLTY